METINLKIEYKDHDICVLHGKNATFTFNPNTRNGEELNDFLQSCDTTDWKSVAEKLAEVVEKQNELVLRICGIVDFDLETVREYKMAIIAGEAESALKEYQKLKDERTIN